MIYLPPFNEYSLINITMPHILHALQDFVGEITISYP